MNQEKKPVYKNWWFWVIIILALGLLGAVIDSNETEKTSSQANNKVLIQENKTTEEVVRTENQETVQKEETQMTLGQKNALAKAKSYLSYTAFSYQGLIEQLEFEGFSHEEAVYGADNCKADWKEQAAKKAKSYMEYSSFSRSGLIEQLEYEKFTSEEAEYGVSAVGY